MESKRQPYFLLMKFTKFLILKRLDNERQNSRLTVDDFETLVKCMINHMDWLRIQSDYNNSFSLQSPEWSVYMVDHE